MMTRAQLIRRLEMNAADMDDFLNLPFNMGALDAGRVLAELYYGLYVAYDYNSVEANDALAKLLREAWEDSLED